MVRALFIGLALLLAVPSAFAVTADELRGAAADKDREIAQRKGRANTGSLGSLLPDAPAPAKSSKYGSGSKPAAKPKAKAAAAGVPAPAPAQESADIYVPPPRSEGGASAGQEFVSDAVKMKVAFGVRLGSWLTASLDRKTTSAESGTVELTLTNDFIGDRRTLPAGTLLFAEKMLNSATKRLELIVTHGITPTGQEFEMRGMVFDPQKQPGLAGVYVIDKKESVARGVSKGAIAAVGAFASTAAGGPAGAAVGTATQSVLNDAGQVTDNNAAQAVIYVSPQTLIIRVERQF